MADVHSFLSRPTERVSLKDISFIVISEPLKRSAILAK